MPTPPPDDSPVSVFSLQASLAELESLKGRLPSVRPPMTFRIAAGVAAVSVLSVALAYLLLVGGLVWLALEYLVSHLRLLTSGTPVGPVVAYVVLSVVGLALLLFLIKPVFRFGAADLAPRVLSRDEQPELYAYVDGLCDALGTPRPHHIQVVVDSGASASLHGLAWGIFSRKPVLTLGLSLVAGVELRRLTGIVAHELAHFTQHGGMRFMRIVNSVNLWFARVVYERDAFDLKLMQLGAVPLVGLPFRFAGFVVNVGRRVLWLFMLLAHCSTGIISRRGEYDADRFMAAVVGSRSIATTLHRVALLDIAMNATREDLMLSMREHRLADDIPALAVARAKRIPADRKEQILRLMKLEKTRWFDTHPSLVNRTQAAGRLNYEALFNAGGRARDLFRDFDGLSRQQTREVYKTHLGDELAKMRVVPTRELVEEIDAAERSNEALGRFYQGKALITRPMLLGPEASAVPKDADAASQALDDARGVMIAAAPEMHEELGRLIKVEERLQAYAMAQALVRAGFSVDPRQFMLRDARPQAIAEAIERTRSKGAELDALIGVYEEQIDRRLRCAAGLLRHPMVRDAIGEPKAGDLIGLMDRLQACSPRLLAEGPRIQGMARDLDALVTMIQARGQSGSSGAVAREIKAATRRVLDTLRALRVDNAQAAYPYTHGDVGTTLGDYLVERMPATEEPAELVFIAGEAVERFEGLLGRAMSDFAVMTETVETALGFVPKAQPEQPDEFETFLLEAERGGGRTRDVAASGAWLPALAAAAMVALGVFLGAVTVGTATPTVTSTIVPHHPSYQPTLVPASVVQRPSGPAYDPYHFFTEPTPRPGTPGYPGHNTPGHPGSPGHNTPQPYYPPGHPNYDPSQPRPGFPNGQPQTPGYQPPTPGRPNAGRPNTPGYQPGRQPSRPSPSGRPSPSPSPRGPSSPGGGGGGGGGFPSSPGGF